MNKLLQDQFGLNEPSIKKLNGYDNANYLVKSTGQKYVFKTYRYDQEMYDLVEAENEVLSYLEKYNSENVYPKSQAFTTGGFVKTKHINGEKTICRMLTFLDGECLGDASHSPKLFNSLGTFLAKMDLNLRPFNNYVIKARQWEWDIQQLKLNEPFIDDISDVKNRNIVRYFFQQYEQNVLPIASKLRKSIIHNDANEWNLLVTDNQISGIIDFGDLAHSFLINELAVAIAYACYDKEKPLEWAPHIISAYHKILPLEAKEISVLYYLVAARLCMSLCNAAHSRKIDASNEYASSSEKPALNMLQIWLTINPIEAENIFRSAIDLPTKQAESTEVVAEKRDKYISKILSTSYGNPIYMKRSAFQYMYDAHGNTYLDAYNNIPHVGHSHPKVVEAGQKQMAKLNTNTRYLYDELAEYAEKLLGHFPDSLDKVYFVNSGSAATDLAIRLAQRHTQKKNLMVMEHGYHGNTQNGIDISDYKFSNKAGQGKKDFILKTAIPDTFRGKYTNNDGTAGLQYANDAKDLIQEANLPIGAFICEPIVGCGGQVPLAKGYLEVLYPEIRKQGGICISDEVQTGFGRLGEHFWGYEMQNVVPDMVILGKPMANGHPMGAVVTTSAIAESFEKGVEFFSSFGGNPVSCAIGQSVLEVIKEEGLQQNAKEVGAYYLTLFKQLQKEFNCIGDVRGSGLFIGVEIVKDIETMEHHPDLASKIKNELRNRNVLISTDGPMDSVIKTKPPMCFSKANAQQVTEQIYEVLRKHS